MSYKVPMGLTKKGRTKERQSLMDLSIEDKDRIFKDYQRGRISIEELADKYWIKYSSARNIIKQNYRIFDTRTRNLGGVLRRLNDNAKTPDVINRVTQKKAQKIYLYYCSQVARKKKSKDVKLRKMDPFVKTCLKQEISDFTLRRIIQFYTEKKEYKSHYGFDQVVAYRKNL